MDRDKITMNTEIGPTAEREINPITEVEETFTTIKEAIGPIIEIEVNQKVTGMEMVIEETTILKTIEEIIIDRTMVIKGIGIEIEVQVRTMVGLGRDIEATPEITSEIGHMTQVRVEIERERERERVETETGPVVERKDKGQKRNLGIEIETGKEKVGPLQSSACVSTNRDRLRCYRCSEYDHFARE